MLLKRGYDPRRGVEAISRQRAEDTVGGVWATRTDVQVRTELLKAANPFNYSAQL